MHNIDIEFSVGDKMLSMKHLNVTGNKKFVPCFADPFSIHSGVGPLAYQLNLGTHYS